MARIANTSSSSTQKAIASSCPSKTSTACRSTSAARVLRRFTASAPRTGRARGRARKVVQEVAEELLKIYSMREARPGVAFARDTAWQQELESSFPYEER